MTTDGIPFPRPRLVTAVPANRIASVAVVIPESTSSLFDDPFFSILLRGISATLGEMDLQLVLLLPQSLRQLQHAEEYLTGGHVDGALLAGLHADDPLPQRLVDRGLPVVVSGPPPRGVRASYVDADNRHGGRLATEHLLSLGRRRVATIGGNLDMGSAVDRLLGYREAIAAAGLSLDPTLEEVADYRPDRALMAMERLLLNHPDVDAVFAASDLMAASALRVLQRSRRRVPEDVALVGYDDSAVSLMVHPTLTTIRQPISEMGSEMVRLLVRRMEVGPGADPETVIFKTELVYRESTGGPPPV